MLRATMSPHRDLLLEVVRRFLRTPSFLVRYFPIEREALDEASVEAAFANRDASGICLGGTLTKGCRRVQVDPGNLRRADSPNVTA